MLSRLVDEARDMPAVSLDAAMAYQKSQDEIQLQVDKTLAEHPDILPLIGFSPLQVMYANHRNHARFMAMVFRLNAHTLLPKVVAWVYRSYHKHGFAYDYFPLELRTWQAAVADRLDPAPAAEINKIYQWLLGRHQEFCELADSVDYTLFSDDSGDPQVQMQILLQHMLNNRFRDCIELAVSSVHSAEELAVFYEEVMKPALYELGRLWERGEVSAAQEHLATAIAMRILSAMYGSFVVGNVGKSRAVITAAPNEFHEVGARMVADQLEMDGWQVDYLGANSPAEDLLALLRQNRPFFIGFSIVVPFNIEEVRNIIEAIRADEALKELKIMVGGPVFALEPELGRRIGADCCVVNSRQALDVARQWWEEGLR